MEIESLAREGQRGNGKTMTWVATFAEKTPLKDGCVAAVGNFDGVHAGHREVLRVAGEEAVRLGVPLVAVTFEPHPRSVLRPDEPLVRLSELPEKVRLLGEAGVDGVAVVGFDLGVAGWSPAKFIDDVLLEWLGVKAVCVGEDFRFGHKASGDVAMLKDDGRFGVRAVGLVKDAEGVVSSRRLRLR